MQIVYKIKIHLSRFIFNFFKKSWGGVNDYALGDLKKGLYRFFEVLFRRQATYTWPQRLPNVLLFLLFQVVAKEPHP